MSSISIAIYKSILILMTFAYRKGGTEMYI